MAMSHNPTQIIAEIGWNHMGDMDLARQMIVAAKECGADYAKFQTWHISNLKEGPWDKDGRRQIYEKAELTKEKHYTLLKICKEVGIQFLTSVFNENDVEFIASLTDKIKIPSTEMDNIPLIKTVIKHFSYKKNHCFYVFLC